MTPIQTSLEPSREDQRSDVSTLILTRLRLTWLNLVRRNFLEISASKYTSILSSLIAKMCSQVSLFAQSKLSTFSRSFLGGVEGLSAINPRGLTWFRSRKPARGWVEIFVFGLGLILSSVEPVNKNLFPFAYYHMPDQYEGKKRVSPICSPESDLFKLHCVALRPSWGDYALRPHPYTHTKHELLYYGLSSVS
jgi:hypothetical protein